MDVEVTTDPEQMPSPADVEALLAATSALLGPSDAAILAQASARMYSWARAIPGAATASVHDGTSIVAFGYGYSWDWATMTDAWSSRLHDELGESAALIDDSFSIVLIVVHPDHRRRHLGAELLTALQAQADESLTWLQTAADSPMRALCDSLDWHPVDATNDPVLMYYRR